MPQQQQTEAEAFVEERRAHIKNMQLTEREWRTVHNALSVFQSQYGTIRDTEYAAKRRKEIQELMDKVRDNFIRTDGI